MGRYKKVIINDFSPKKEKKDNHYLIEREDKRTLMGLIAGALAYLFCSVIPLTTLMGEYLDKMQDNSFSTIIESIKELPAREVFPFYIKVVVIFPTIIFLMIVMYIAVHRDKEEK